jgi:hypothetical protein
MPDGLLLFAFALTLVANAVLIAVAIRAMRKESGAVDAARSKPAADARPASPPRPDAAAEATAERDRVTPRRGEARRTAALARPLPLAPPPPSARSLPLGTSVPTVVAATVVAAAGPAELEEPAAQAPKRRRPSVKSATGEPGDSTPAASGAPATPPVPTAPGVAGDLNDAGASAPRRAGTSRSVTPRSGASRRRRFSLPPLDEDHEKVNRSIETFLSGGDAGADAGSTGSGGAADRESGLPPTTVALVAVVRAGSVPPQHGAEGTERPSADDAAGETRPGGKEPPAESGSRPTQAEAAAVAAVHRSLRAAARGTDHVETLGPGRFRIVLASTGELAARAYLRRVRATVEPLLEELDPPRRLAVATATILGDPIDRAYEIVERRLAAIVDRATPEEDRGRTTDERPAPSTEPEAASRAAGDD